MKCVECRTPTDGRMYCCKRCMRKASDRRIARRKLSEAKKKKLEAKWHFEDVPALSDSNHRI